MAAVIFFAILAGIYASLYYVNHKTPVPKGCEKVKSECVGCHNSACANHPSHDY